MDSLFVQFQREYCSAVQTLRTHLNSRAADGSQGLLEEIKIIVSICRHHHWRSMMSTSRLHVNCIAVLTALVYARLGS